MRYAAAALAAALASGCASSPAREDFPADLRPNIVVIVADDLGWADLGFRTPEVRTPNIDRLAAEGTRLERFYTAAVCSPTRAGLMTGRYPDRYGMRRGVIEPSRRHGLPPEEETIAEMLATAGYVRRAALGKWHLGHSSTKYHPLRQGFTEFYGHYNGAIDYFTHERNGELDWHRGFESSYDQGYSTDLLAAEGARFIRNSRDGKPFLLYLAFNAVHSPMQAKREHLDRQGFDPAAGTFRESTGGTQPGEANLERYGKIGNGNTIRQTYLAMLAGLDDGVGTVLSALEETGAARNTLVLFMSDNGGTPQFGGSNRPLRGNKATEYEGGVRVNAIARWPARIAPGGTVDRVISYVDVLPTLRRIAGISRAPARPLDGVDVLHLLEGGQGPSDRVLYLGNGSVVSQRWKLVRGELFEIERDPFETTSLAASRPDTLAAYTRHAERFRAIEGPSTEQGRYLTPPEWRMPDDPAPLAPSAFGDGFRR